jgi:hypothetical protein
LQWPDSRPPVQSFAGRWIPMAALAGGLPKADWHPQCVPTNVGHSSANRSYPNEEQIAAHCASTFSKPDEAVPTLPLGRVKPDTEKHPRY